MKWRLVKPAETLATVIDEAAASGAAPITRRGKSVAAILSAADYELLVAAADESVDRKELAAAREENDYLPWERSIDTGFEEHLHGGIQRPTARPNPASTSPFRSLAAGWSRHRF